VIFVRPADDDNLDQGDILDDCPLPWTAFWDLDRDPQIVTEVIFQRVIVLTQTCDLANNKVNLATVAIVREAEALVRGGVLKAADVKGPIRAGRIWGLYFLPKADDLGLPESIVDLRQLHTVRLDMLRALCQRGKRTARLQPLYREHLNKFFGDTYSRIGLPQQYATE
jgi:hypothetical protein